MKSQLDKHILRPIQQRAKLPYVDFILALDYLSVNSQLLLLMQEAMHARGLGCLLVNHTNVEAAIRQARRGWLSPVVFLDLCSRPGNVFETLLHAMHDAGAHTICSPAQLQWTYKALSHPKLVAAGLALPPTVIIDKSEADRELTSEEHQALGVHCVIKPSFGVGGLGAVIDVPPTMANLAQAREYNRDDHWLIQKMVRWGTLGGRQAYLRAYNIMGHQTLMWWNGQTGYAPLTWDEFREHDLMGAVELTRKIAALTGMDFFSSEIAITDGPERFVLIDYINDQCDIDPQAQPDRSPPAAWVEWICGRFAEFAFRKKHGRAGWDAGTLRLM